MHQSITFKTELNELITLEEVSVLFDNIASKYATSLASISLYPDFINLKKEIIKATAKQRNYELSTLLTKIIDRKQEINNEMKDVINKLEINKKHLEKVTQSQFDLEQTIYEQEQTIKAYQESLRLLEKKEKKIMSGKYQRINIISALPRIKSLKRQLEYMKKKILFISVQHDDCFKEYENELDNLIKKSIITKKNIIPVRKQSVIKKNIFIENCQKFNGIFENIDYISKDTDENIYDEETVNTKDFYLYEPSERNFDDELIYQLLRNANYDEEDGSINGLLITTEFDAE